MAGFEAQSGNQGYAIWGSSTIIELIKWDMKKNPGTNKYNAVSGSGWQKTAKGNKAISGTITGKYTPDDDVRTIVDTEDLVTLELHLDSGNYETGQARLSDFSISSNVDSGEPQEWSASFESHGTWTRT